MFLYGTLAICRALVINASNALFYLFFIPILWSHFICFCSIEKKNWGERQRLRDLSNQ